MLFTGCSRNKYDVATELYKKGKYTTAIEFYDTYINRELTGSIVTQAELERGDCYYQIGTKAYNKKNWDLAIKLFYLSNTQRADEMTDNCYFELANIALENKEIDVALEHYQFIIDLLKTSELIPEILHNRINIYLNLDKKFLAYEDYNSLCQMYPDDEYTTKAQAIIDENMQFFIDEAISYQEAKYFNISLEKLLYLENNPTKYYSTIKNEIGNIYILLAESKMKETEYLDGKKFYEKALEWDVSKKNLVEKRFNEVVDLFIDKGNSLIKKEKIEEAIANYKEVFDIIPDHPKARNAIGKAINLRRDIEQAKRLEKKAKSMHKEKRFAKALQYYKQSNALRKNQEIIKEIQHMENLIEAEESPIAFAKKIMFAYKNGKVKNKVHSLEKEMSNKYADAMKTSGWRVSYAVGKYNYEVRYDITSPKEEFYFVWRINLENRIVTPLNKIAENILEEN